ncbi:MAG: hypothetical protein IIT38_04070, partial [Bacteroidales bacterium]|nr:hypothetical protein [Bacteroidales bacterium]
ARFNGFAVSGFLCASHVSMAKAVSRFLCASHVSMASPFKCLRRLTLTLFLWLRRFMSAAFDATLFLLLRCGVPRHNNIKCARRFCSKNRQS